MHASVLVVEQYAALRLVIAEALLSFGYRVTVCASVEGALSTLKNGQQVDLIMTCIRMEGALNGLDFVKIVLENWPQTPVIVASGTAVHTYKPLPPQVGFIAKPWTTDQLHQVVSDSLTQLH
jgi:CheY-like chemotaxis protein